MIIFYIIVLLLLLITLFSSIILNMFLVNQKHIYNKIKLQRAFTFYNFMIKQSYSINNSKKRLILAGICLIIYPAPHVDDTLFYFVESSFCSCEGLATFEIEHFFSKAVSFDELDWSTVILNNESSQSINYCIMSQKYDSELDNFVWFYDSEYNAMLREEAARSESEIISLENWRSKI